MCVFDNFTLNINVMQTTWRCRLWWLVAWQASSWSWFYASLWCWSRTDVSPDARWICSCSMDKTTIPRANQHPYPGIRQGHWYNKGVWYNMLLRSLLIYYLNLKNKSKTQIYACAFKQSFGKKKCKHIIYIHFFQISEDSRNSAR